MSWCLPNLIDVKRFLLLWGFFLLSNVRLVFLIAIVRFTLDMSYMTVAEIMLMKEHVLLFRNINPIVWRGDLYRLWNPFKVGIICYSIPFWDWFASFESMISLVWLHHNVEGNSSHHPFYSPTNDESSIWITILSMNLKRICFWASLSIISTQFTV